MIKKSVVGTNKGKRTQTKAARQNGTMEPGRQFKGGGSSNRTMVRHHKHQQSKHLHKSHQHT